MLTTAPHCPCSRVKELERDIKSKDRDLSKKDARIKELEEAAAAAVDAAELEALRRVT